MTPESASASRAPAPASAPALAAFWGRDALWQIRLRWAVPPAIVAGTLTARTMGVGVSWPAMLAVALAILVYNALLWAVLVHGLLPALPGARWLRRRAEPVQVAVDYAFTLALVHLTGGVSSPLLGLLLLHVVVAAILLPPGAAWLAAIVAAGGATMLAVAEYAGYLPPAPLSGWPVTVTSTYLVAVLLFFTMMLFALAGAATAIMSRLRAENARAAQAQAELLAERARFTLQLVHNLRAPLAAAVGLVELVTSELPGPLNADQCSYLGRAAHRLREMSDGLGDLLTLARRGQFERPESVRPLDLHTLALEVVATFEETAAHRGVHLAFEGGASSWVNGDRRALIEMIENLVSNAVRYTPAGGSVAVAVADEPTGEVSLTVSDTGIGIPQADQAHLFEQFFRASNARGSGTAGTGLGLAIVRQVAEQHGGRVTFTSREGQGTTFTVTFPGGVSVLESAGSAPQAPPTADTSAASG
jgi:signal transduction histidine kinase